MTISYLRNKRVTKKDFFEVKFPEDHDPKRLDESSVEAIKSSPAAEDAASADNLLAVKEKCKEASAPARGRLFQPTKNKTNEVEVKKERALNLLIRLNQKNINTLKLKDLISI